MNPITRNIIIATALLFGLACGGILQAQTSGETAAKGRRVLAVPIQVVGAKIREVPSNYMRKLAKGEDIRTIQVLDLSVKVSSRALEAFPPSLQPILHIGGKAYPVQRVEYSNWDARNEKPIDKNTPVGITLIIHFFIEDWQKLERGQPMILSILSPEEIGKATGGQYTVEQFNRILPELQRKIQRYAPREFMKLGR
jgi:hypothetical protein